MRRSHLGFLFIGVLLTAIGTMASAGDSNDDLIEKDHKLIEGTWNVVTLEVGGNKANDEDAKKVTVVNGSDGTWSVRSEGKEIVKGTSTIYPTQKPRIIDFTPTEGDRKGEVHLGIYELNENTRKLCFAPPGKPRPTEFSTANGSENILVTFERDKDDAIKRDRQRIQGTWLATSLEVNGNKASEEDVKNFKVVIGADGTWNVSSDGNEINQGTSTVDPIKSPKFVDFTPTTGDDKGKPSPGIYEVGEDTLKFCVAPNGKDRPAEFSSTAGSEHILVTFKRDKSK